MANESQNYLGATNWWSQGRHTGETAIRIKTVPPPTGITFDAGNTAPLVAGGIADAGGTTTTMVDAARTEADDFWNGKSIRFTNGANKGLIRFITDFVAGTDTLTFHPAVGSAVGAGDTYDIIASSLTNRIVLTGYHVAITNTDAAAAEILFRHVANNPNVVLDFFAPATTGVVNVTNNNVWLPMEESDSLESVAINLTGVATFTCWGKVLPASTPVAMKYLGDATNP